ncbi:MAG TPA: flagellar basal body-associated FliL family protein [Burkholderiaceae bacterium]|jgi:flagellar FliL protein|nr:flagellar basal body-associated FliL family protein [Burkholderiaceae bacterium]
MADSKQGAAPAPAAAPARAGKGLSKKLIISVAAVLLTAAGGAGAFFLLKRGPAAEAEKKDEQRKLPNFVDLEQFTVNLAEKDQDRYMQIRFSLEVASHEAEATIKEMMPALRSEILLVLGARPSTDLASREGKETLAKDIVAAANKSLEHTPADHSVTAVRITQLIVQ